MSRLASVVLILALATIGTAISRADSAGVTPQLDSDFCTTAPTGVDDRLAAAVNALGVGVSATPPIAVLDTGVNAAVPEIAGRVVAPFDVTAGVGDGNDVDGHGTEVAGIAAGSPGLVEGVSPTSPIMPVRVYNRVGDATIQWLVAGINRAVANHAAVVNISSASLAGDATAADIAALTRATTDAFNHDVMVVASVGNDGKLEAELPASLPHVIGVGASNLTGDRAAFSNTGPWVDLVAPAASLVAPMPKAYCPSGYGVANGTSFAAPAVAGAAALLAAVRPTLTPEQRFDILRTSARDVDPTGRDDNTGYGLLDVKAALNAPLPPAESSPEVDDDPFYVRGANAAGHTTLLTRSRRAKLAGDVSPAKDPADVYRLRLKRGERLTVAASTTTANGLLALGLWKPTVGDFDVSNQVAKNELVSTGGFASDPSLKTLAKKTGTYFLSVEAPDPVDPDDPTSESPAVEPYRVMLSKTLRRR